MADLALLEEFDAFVGVRRALRGIADGIGEWAGIPMPLDGETLVVEPRFPNADKLMAIGRAPEPEPPPEPADNWTVRNVFWSWRWRCEVVIYEEAGRIRWGRIPTVNHARHQLSTLGAADAWGLSQERNALDLLGTLVGHRAFKQYLLTGMFLETSARSGVVYMFRRLRPTLALSVRNTETKILAALCLHPIAYYQGSWAGAMTPTDDVVAHLMLMRGDEKLFWRRANQHPAYRPEAGL